MNSELIPTKCPSCGTKLEIEGVHLVCKNKNCLEKCIMQILHWIQSSGMENISESFVRKLVNSEKISSIKDLYSLKENDFEGIDGFGSKKIKNALEQIEMSKNISVRQFVVRLGVNGIGERAVEKLGINKLTDLWGFEPVGVIGVNLSEFVESNVDFINELITVLKVSDGGIKKKNGLFICLTGTGPKSRKELISEIENMGHTFVDHVGKDTNILVCEDVNGSSGKLAKARKLGVKLVGYNEFFK